MSSIGELWDLNETCRWRSREVRYVSGGWEAICELLPEFELVPFREAPGALANPYLRTVRRKTLDGKDQLPVGTVSPGYVLVQHRKLANLCRQGLVDAGVDEAGLYYEVGLSALGEWMNLRIYLPEEHSICGQSGARIALRLECFNAVEGSASIVILFGWFRTVCANGMVIGETKVKIRERHLHRVELRTIPKRIAASLNVAEGDRLRMTRWQETSVSMDEVARWVDEVVSRRWRVTAAARVYHICRSGRDIRLVQFESGSATERPVRLLGPVTGSPAPARTMHDVSQALSYVATHRTDADDRLSMQSEVAALMKALANQS